MAILWQSINRLRLAARAGDRCANLRKQETVPLNGERGKFAVYFAGQKYKLPGQGAVSIYHRFVWDLFGRDVSEMAFLSVHLRRNRVRRKTT